MPVRLKAAKAGIHDAVASPRKRMRPGKGGGGVSSVSRAADFGDSVLGSARRGGEKGGVIRKIPSWRRRLGGGARGPIPVHGICQCEGAARYCRSACACHELPFLPGFSPF